MGYAFMLAPCGVCHKPMSFNPHLVPSARGTPDGPREPICRQCIETANPKRIERGLPPIKILPGAYEPVSEEEL